MNYSLFRDLSDPYIIAQKKLNESLFKDQKLVETGQTKKRVTALTWDLSGQRLITGSSDGCLRIYTLESSGNLKRINNEVRGHSEQIYDIVWDPTSENIFYTTSKDKQIKKWDINSKGQQAIAVGRGKEEIINLAISPDGKQLGVSNNKDELIFYDVRTSLDKHEKAIKMKSDINAIAWDKGEGRFFFITDQNGTISVLDGNSHENLRASLADCHSGQCYALAVDNNNRYLATGGQDSLIGIWDLQDFLLIKTLGQNDSKVMALSLNADGSLIASISEDDLNKKYLIEIYDFDYSHPYSGGNTLFSYTTPYEKQGLSWNPKRNVLALAGEDKEGGGVVQILNPTAAVPASEGVIIK